MAIENNTEHHESKLNLSPALREVISNAKANQAVRDLRMGLVQTKALLYAIGCIQALPENQQEYSDMLDMCEMVRELGDYHIATLLFDVERHLDRQIDLWRDGFGDEAYAVRRDHVRQIIRDFGRMVERAAQDCAV